MEVEINIKEKIIYKSFKTQNDLEKDILRFIIEDKLNKVIYHGDPYDIKYKLIKKIMDNNISPDGNFRSSFRRLIQHTKNEPYCIIYKK
jgi:hypothetical protein